MRTDIPVVGQLVQIGHACYQAGAAFKPAQGLSTCDGQDQVPNLILIGVESEKALMEEVEGARLHGIRIEVFHETGVVYTGRTEPVSGYTAACTEPLSGGKRRWFQRLQLYS